MDCPQMIIMCILAADKRQVTIDLAPGSHTLQLVLGDAGHVPHSTPIMSDVISITVE